MKPNMEKLYDKTPTDALATLAAGAFFRSDDDELRRIVAAVSPRYAGAHQFFIHRRSALTTTALLWCLDVQSTYSMSLKMDLFLGGVAPGTKRFFAVEITRRAMQCRLACLVDAQRQICSANGIDFEDVARFAGVAEMGLSDDEPTIPEVVAELVELYQGPTAN